MQCSSSVRCTCSCRGLPCASTCSSCRGIHCASTRSSCRGIHCAGPSSSCRGIHRAGSSSSCHGVHRAPAPAVPVVEYIAPAPAVPFVEYIAPAPAVNAAPAPVVEDTASALVSPPTPVVEYIASVPTSTPAVSSPPATCVQSRQSAHRVSTEVPTVSSRHHHDELFRAERVLRARAARQGYLFRQMKRRDTQLAAQLSSLGKACEVVRGSPVASLLVPVAMREQGLSSKLLAFEKQLEDHEVAVLELERQGKLQAALGPCERG